ncbi:MAG: MaoC family dehydratase [Dehalococcoidia bacterium]|nr:MaoC family dehydratase [Dehalococcoidia bacterium]
MDRVAALTGTGTYFEDFPVGRKMRHARGATVDEVENNYLSKAVVNTAQAHWNEHASRGGNSPLGEGRVVFGLITGSMVIGLASQDTAENAIAEVRLDKLRFTSPVHHGDTIYAFSEVIAAEASPERGDAGLVTFKHWGVTHDDRVVFEGERTVLVKRRSHWGAR